MSKDLTNQRFKRLVALEPTDQRKNKCIVWKCRCDCGNICYVPSGYLTSGKKGSCGCLEKENQQSIGQRINNMKDISGQKFGRLTAIYPTEKRSGTSVVWHCKCECGNECDISAGALGKTVFSCGCLRRELGKEKGKQFILDVTGQKFGKLTVIKYIDMPDRLGSYWLCQCDCGKQCIVSRQSLVQNNTSSCGCLRNYSKGEYFIKKILDEAKIFYEQEVPVDVGFKSGCPARFDFKINTSNNYYLIEYDGEQHFQNTGYGILKETQERDKIKNKWCKENNIPLIRIPYWHLEKICLEDLLLETSQFIME